tara:strand:+ start:325 stop:597 length:273 start_codon:yes stop_codon:yes gene_type:complete
MLFNYTKDEVLIKTIEISQILNVIFIVFFVTYVAVVVYFRRCMTNIARQILRNLVLFFGTAGVLSTGVILNIYGLRKEVKINPKLKKLIK